MGLFDGLFGGSGSGAPAAPAPVGGGDDASFFKSLSGIIGRPQIKMGMGIGPAGGASAAAMMGGDPNSKIMEAILARMGGPGGAGGSKPTTVQDNPTHESPVYRYRPGPMGLSPADMLQGANTSAFGLGSAFSNPFSR